MGIEFKGKNILVCLYRKKGLKRKESIALVAVHIRSVFHFDIQWDDENTLSDCFIFERTARLGENK
jgi:hypothetical protein